MARIMNRKAVNGARTRRILPTITPRVKQDALFRLKSVSGHIEGVIRMLEREEYCIDVIKQLAAVETALKKISAVLLKNHLDTCVTVAINEKKPAVRTRVVKELLEIFLTEERSWRTLNPFLSSNNRKLKGKPYGKRSSMQHAGGRAKSSSDIYV